MPRTATDINLIRAADPRPHSRTWACLFCCGWTATEPELLFHFKVPQPIKLRQNHDLSEIRRLWCESYYRYTHHPPDTFIFIVCCISVRLKKICSFVITAPCCSIYVCNKCNAKTKCNFMNDVYMHRVQDNNCKLLFCTFTLKSPTEFLNKTNREKKS